MTEIDSMSKLKNVIQETKDYSIFKRLPGNRQVNKGLVNDLIRSYTEKPQLIMARPLLLNENFEVVDGQHRHEALQRTGHAIPYMVVKGLTIKDARLLNALQRSWTLGDFARSFAETEGGAYQRFIELMEEYHLPPRVLLMYTTGSTGTSGSGHLATDFRHGRYMPRGEQITREWLDKLTEFEPYMKRWNEQAFASAVIKLFILDNYDHARMIRKLHDSNTRLIHRSGATDYLRDLETVYNMHNPSGHYVRFV